MLAPHEDAVQLAVHLRTLEMAGQLVVGTYDEVLALQAMNSRIEADPASPAGFALTLRRLATGEAAEAAGITCYDVALPQPWVDHMTAVAGDPRGHFVWSYQRSPVCGEPFATTTHGAHLLSVFSSAPGGALKRRARPTHPGKKISGQRRLHQTLTESTHSPVTCARAPRREPPMPEQRNPTADAYQALFDLMANRDVRIEMEGRLGDVDLTVLVRGGVLPTDPWIETGSVFAQDTPADALEELHRAGAMAIPD